MSMTQVNAETFRQVLEEVEHDERPDDLGLQHAASSFFFNDMRFAQSISNGDKTIYNIDKGFLVRIRQTLQQAEVQNETTD